MRGRPSPYSLNVVMIEAIKEAYMPGQNTRQRGERIREVSHRFGVPRWWIGKQAARLGVRAGWPEGRRNWTREEILFLEENVGQLSAEVMARRLKRSYTSICLKIKRLHLLRRKRDGWFTLRDLERGFNTDHRMIQRWIDRGWLRAGRDVRKSGPDGARYWRISANALADFIWEHPTGFDIRRVDPVWFLSVLQLCSDRAAERAD